MVEIRCKDLVKIYKTEETEVLALQGLDLEVKGGEFIAIIGKSGSGKSTLLNIIGGLEVPTAGEIYVNDVKLNTMTKTQIEKYREKTCGFVWQKAVQNLFPYMTALENVMSAKLFQKMSASEKRIKAMAILEEVGMKENFNKYPKVLSGGEQQRVAIAMALMNDPELLLADEPTGAVDTKTSKMIEDLLRNISRTRNVAVIMVTHDRRLADRVDRVLMISDGKISNERILKQEYMTMMAEAKDNVSLHDEYLVLDGAGRVQLSEELLEEAGIDGKHVKIKADGGKLIITGR